MYNTAFSLDLIKGLCTQALVCFSKYISYSKKDKLPLPKKLASLQQRMPFKEWHLLKNSTAIMAVSANGGSDSFLQQHPLL